MKIDSVIPRAIDLNIYCFNRWHFHYHVLSIPMEDKHASASPSIEPHHVARKKSSNNKTWILHKPPARSEHRAMPNKNIVQQNFIGWLNVEVNDDFFSVEIAEAAAKLASSDLGCILHDRTASVLFDDFGKPSKKITSKALNSRYLRNSKPLIRGH